MSSLALPVSLTLKCPLTGGTLNLLCVP